MRKLLKTIAVWYLYVPHLALLRLLGVRAGLRFARLCAWGHWLLTFLGANARLRRALERTLPELRAGMSVNTILRKHLEVKYQHFVEWHLADTPGGQAFIKRTYQNVEGWENHPEDGGGIIVLGFHFGMMKMIRLGLRHCYGFEAYEIVFRSATYAKETLPYVAKLALHEAVQTDRRSGLKNIYIKPNATPMGVIRRLRKGQIVGMAGDGMVADEFLDVPFLGGTMRFPTGVARLSAITGAPIVPLFGLLESIEKHRIIIHPPIRCLENTNEAVEETVKACAAVLESYVRRCPWAWWIWHRLQFEEQHDGRLRLSARANIEQDVPIHYEPLVE